MATAAWRVELVGLKELQKRMAEDIKALQGAAVLAGYRDAALKVYATALREAKVDTGRWRASLHPFVELHENVIEAGAGSNLDYGPFAEFDSKPHWAPLQPILEWVRRKHLAGTYSTKSRRRRGNRVSQFYEDYAVALAIQRKIARVGTKGDHALEKGLTKNVEWIVRRLERAYAEALRE